MVPIHTQTGTVCEAVSARSHMEKRHMRLTTLRHRFLNNFKDPVMRTKVLALIGGKAIGLTLLVTAMGLYLGGGLHAQAPAAPAGPTPDVNAINTSWTLIAAFLVFGMQLGFVMLEAGFARSRE